MPQRRARLGVCEEGLERGYLGGGALAVLVRGLELRGEVRDGLVVRVGHAIHFVVQCVDLALQLEVARLGGLQQLVLVLDVPSSLEFERGEPLEIM